VSRPPKRIIWELQFSPISEHESCHKRVRIAAWRRKSKNIVPQSLVD
jgi:hypothetical protein